MKPNFKLEFVIESNAEIYIRLANESNLTVFYEKVTEQLLKVAEEYNEKPDSL